MKIKSLFLACLVTLSVTSCNNDDDASDVVKVAFKSVESDGESEKATTTKLTLTFDKEIAGLTADNITLSEGATKGALTSKGEGVYELAVTDITEEKIITVTITKSDITVTPNSQKVEVYKDKEKYSFKNVVADGAHDATTTSMLTLTFDKEIAGFTADNITLSEGATKGDFAPAGKVGDDFTYNLGVTGITEEKEITVTIAKDNVIVTPNSQTVTVYKADESGNTITIGTDKYEVRLVENGLTIATLLATYTDLAQFITHAKSFVDEKEMLLQSNDYDIVRQIQTMLNLAENCCIFVNNPGKESFNGGSIDLTWGALSDAPQYTYCIVVLKKSQLRRCHPC